MHLFLFVLFIFYSHFDLFVHLFSLFTSFNFFFFKFPTRIFLKSFQQIKILALYFVFYVVIILQPSCSPVSSWQRVARYVFSIQNNCCKFVSDGVMLQHGNQSYFKTPVVGTFLLLSWKVFMHSVCLCVCAYFNPRKYSSNSLKLIYVIQVYRRMFRIENGLYTTDSSYTEPN